MLEMLLRILHCIFLFFILYKEITITVGIIKEIDGHMSDNDATMSFLIFVKENYSNPTSVYATQIAGLYDTTNNTTYTSYFDLGVSSNGTLTIKNKTSIIARYRFI